MSTSYNNNIKSKSIIFRYLIGVATRLHKKSKNYN